MPRLLSLLALLVLLLPASVHAVEDTPLAVAAAPEAALDPLGLMNPGKVIG